MSDALRSLLLCRRLVRGLQPAADGGLHRPQGLSAAQHRVDRQKNILEVGRAGRRGPQLPRPRRSKPFTAAASTACWVDRDGQIVDPPKRSPGELPDLPSPERRPDQGLHHPHQHPGAVGKDSRLPGLERRRPDDARVYRLQAHRNPGAGGEIERHWFQKNFVGKKIVDAQGEFVSIAIAKGKVDQAVACRTKRANYVDGISGATLTGKYLSAGLHRSLAATMNRWPSSSEIRTPARSPWETPRATRGHVT